MNISVFKDNQELSSFNLTNASFGNKGELLELSIGRVSDCYIQLDDKKISREHALLIFQENEWKIRKKSHHSIMFVNGVDVSEKVISHGDKIKIGDFELLLTGENTTFSIPAPEPSVASDNIADLDNEATKTVLGQDDGSLEEDVDNQATQTVLGDENELDMSMSEDENELDPIDDQNEEEVYEAAESEDFEAGDDNEFDDNFNSDDDDGFGSNEDSFDGDMVAVDDEKTRVISSFVNLKLELFGEYAPYDEFEIEENEILIGRDNDKCHIFLNDPEVSAIHAKIKKTALSCNLEDLKSGNGTILNGKKINSTNLKNGDEFIIGATTFTLKISSDFLDQEQDRLMPVAENQVIEVEEVLEVSDGDFLEGEDFDLSETSASLFSKDALKNPEKRKKILYIVVGLLALWVLLDDGEQAAKPAPKKKVAKVKKAEPKGKAQKKLTQSQKEFVDSQYLLAKELFQKGSYPETIHELDKVFKIVDEYKESRQIYNLSKEGFAELERIRIKKEEELKIKELKAKTDTLIVKAREAIKNEEMTLAKGFLDKVIELDPERFEVPQLRLEIDSYERKKEREALAAAEKKANRSRQVESMAAGKSFYIKKEWFKAIKKLDEFLKQKGLDEDLLKEGSSMLQESKDNLANTTGPLLGKARSLKEGQDLKGAFETYKQIIIIDPINTEALNEMDDIDEKLTLRSRKLYREAIISEDLSLFQAAKEKFEEVKQVSPIGSEYYNKANERLKKYID